MQDELTRIERAIGFIQGGIDEPFQPRVGVVLGSGLGGLVERMELLRAIPYDTIPGFLKSTVEGHAGQLCLGRLAGVQVAVMQGRIHVYEGHPLEDVVLPVRVLARLGAGDLVITNAAGGVNPSYQAGDLMLIRDHLNLTGRNPLLGPNEPRLGPRFPDLSVAYDAGHRALALEVAAEQKLQLHQGVYAGLLGPSYETPAEIQMLRGFGADAVGMSTVLEVIAARHMGARVLGLSCISNQAAGISPTLLSHDEVKLATAEAAGRFQALISGWIARLASMPRP